VTTTIVVRHWLVTLATRSGCMMLSDPSLAPDASAADAWAAVAQACRITTDELARRIAAHYRLNVAQLDAPDPVAQSLLPESFARRFLLFPVRETDRQLVVATANPTDLDAEQAIGFASGRTPVLEIAPPAAIQRAIDAHYAPDRAVERLLDRVGAEVASDVLVVDDHGPEMVAARDLESAPVVKLTGMILTDAVRSGASDIHLEPGRDGGVVRFRIDGVLRTHMQLPMPALNRVVSRIKVMGKMDIADRLRPQDGRTRIQTEGRTLDLRISTVPTREAEKAVIRLLDPGNSKTLADLAIPAHELDRFRRLLLHRDGIVVVTGPTGSGKTTTLYAALRQVATGEVNVMTVEDPVEYELPGMTQIQVEPRRGVTFASALRSILRQDPNVIFIGEIRDLETAEIAVQAALTGHLVLATIHANDAVGAIARFTDLGLDHAKISGTLRGALAQRLLRRVCGSCAVAVDASLTTAEQALADRYGVRPMKRAVGCQACGQSGYRGRLPIIEVMVAGPWLEPKVRAGSPAADLQKAAVAGGMRSLREVALERVKSGETTLEEVERVLGGGEAVPVPTAAPHILLVDDDAVTRAIARGVLEKAGYRVSESADGIEALERLQEGHDFVLMVLDVEMPRLGGAEVLDRIRRSVATAGLPVIVLTGSTAEFTEVDMMERGADDYVRKPLDPLRFVARIRAALRRAGG
jgi:type II secretory ATPase GspE/PulE/Tfp pilus assembly ATPase PilB-like protein/CheY-like chemotaxis protein